MEDEINKLLDELKNENMQTWFVLGLFLDRFSRISGIFKLYLSASFRKCKIFQHLQESLINTCKKEV